MIRKSTAMARKPLPMNNGGMPYQLYEQLMHCCIVLGDLLASGTAPSEGHCLATWLFVFIYLTLCSWESQKHGNFSTLPVWPLLLQQFGANPKHRVILKLPLALSCTWLDPMVSRGSFQPPQFCSMGNAAPQEASL